MLDLPKIAPLVGKNWAEQNADILDVLVDDEARNLCCLRFHMCGNKAWCCKVVDGNADLNEFLHMCKTSADVLI